MKQGYNQNLFLHDIKSFKFKAVNYKALFSLHECGLSKI